ncbi:hypothetical protein ACA910_004874 [Epithemia clementina (nom. ined.)]
MIVTPSSSYSTFRNTAFNAASSGSTLGSVAGQENSKHSCTNVGAVESIVERQSMNAGVVVAAPPRLAHNRPEPLAFLEMDCSTAFELKDDQRSIKDLDSPGRSPRSIAKLVSSPPIKPCDSSRSRIENGDGPGCRNLSGLFNSPMNTDLKTRSAMKNISKKAPKRRVQWQWNESSLDSFSNLSDPTLQRILSFLTMKDIVALSYVSSRWRFLALQPACWENVDATDFVQATHFHVDDSTSNAAKRTADILASRLRSYAPKKLTIRSIGNRIQPDSYLPSISGLGELALSEFNELSDTHVHVMLLSSSALVAQARSKISNSLRKLILEDCPLVTNSTVRSIGSLCRELEYLSLSGCHGVSDVMPLRDMFRSIEIETTNVLKKINLPPASLHSMFLPPKPSLNVVSPCNAAAVGLASLFAPPGDPVKAAQRPHQPSGLSSLFHPPGASKASPDLARASVVGGQLSGLNLSRTSVTAAALVDAIRATRGNVVLESLEMRGSGESWTDSLLEKLGSCRFKVLDISCTDLKSGSTGVTDMGIRSLSKTKLEKLCLSGQKGINPGLVSQILSAAPMLHSLDIAACPTLFKGDTGTVPGVAVALKETRILEYINLSRCFADEAKAGSSPQVLKADEEKGKMLVDALCTSPSRWTLKELDLSWCWFVTAMEVAKVRTACPNLERMHLLGTRCNQI